jgi:hypothetical protein
VPVGLPVAVVLDHLLPGGQELRRAPATICERCPGTPHDRCWETEGGQAGNDGAAALEQATAEEHPQQVEETQIRAKGHASDYTRQHVLIR